MVGDRDRRRIRTVEQRPLDREEVWCVEYLIFKCNIFKRGQVRGHSNASGIFFGGSGVSSREFLFSGSWTVWTDRQRVDIRGVLGGFSGIEFYVFPV